MHERRRSLGRASIGVLDVERELMTADEAIEYLRLNADGRDAKERLRNLVRRQRLPMIRRGRLQLFRKAAIDAWLDGNRTLSPARQLVG